MTAELEAMLDLGEIAGPLLVFGGPYSNLRATEAMRDEAKRRGIPAANVICTGDVVAYAGEPDATTDAIMDWGITTVMGNCEESFGWDADDCGCGFEEGTACDVMSRAWYAYANGRLNAEQRAWMRGLPRLVKFNLGGRSFAVIHGSAASINEFVFEGSSDGDKLMGLCALDVDAVIGGHSGVPFTQILNGRLWHNAGVIGMPANDGTPRVWYSVIDAEGDDIVVHHHALSYDHAGAAQSMRELKLPEGYAQCLETGLWPNMDVMPELERARAGAPIGPQTVVWERKELVAAE